MSNSKAATRAILQGRRPGRAPVWLIIGLVIAGLCLALITTIYVLSTRGTAFLIFLLALPTAVFYLGLVLLVDRVEPEPKLLMLFVFLWGAGTATLFAGELNSFNQEVVFTPLVGKVWGEQLTVSVSAPVVEETLKALPLLFLLIFRRQEVNGITDAVVYASMSGLGFALVENVQYYLGGFGDGGLGGLVFVYVLRGVFSPLCHPMFTFMTALGVLYAANRGGGKGVLAVIGGWIAAMFLHSLWNTSGLIGSLLGVHPIVSLGLVYVPFLALLIVIVVLLVKDRKRTVGLISRYLPQYAGTGAVTPADVQMLGTVGNRKRARKYIASRYGMRARQAMGDYQMTATELAMLHEKAEKGGVKPADFQRRQGDLVQLLTATYSQAMGGTGVGPAPWQQGPAQPPPQAPPQQPYGPPHGQPPQQGPPPSFR